MTAHAAEGARASAYAMLALTILVFGGQFVDARLAIRQGLSAFDLVALRFLFAAAIGLPVLLRAGIGNAGGVGWPRALLLTVLAGSPYSLLMIGGLNFAPVAHGALLNPGLNMVFSTVFGFWLLAERHRPLRWLGIVVITIGLALIGWDGLTDVSGAFWIGDLMFAATGVSWALFGVLSRRWRLSPPIAVSAIAVASLPYWIVYWFGGFATLGKVALPWLLFHGIYQGWLHSFVAMICYTYCIARLGAGTTSVGTSLVPASAMTIAIIVLSEWPNAWQWAGLLTVVAGMLVANLPWRRAPR